METPFIDIHTHKRPVPGTGLFSVRIGHDAIPEEGLFSAGIHPWDTLQATEAWFGELRESNPAAIGEIGLDYARPIDREQQRALFSRQLAFAAEKRIPAIVHCVRAFNELPGLLNNRAVPVIIHGFTGSRQLALQLAGAGHYLSFGETLLRSPKTREALAALPDERIFLETDQSALSIEDIYAEAASIRACSASELKEAVYSNFRTLFER